MQCPACQHHNRAHAKFCEECGSRLPSSLKAAAKTAEQGQPLAQEYTPKHLRESVFKTNAAMVGEHKQVTIMFADVKGSLRLAEKMTAEVWHQVLDRFFAILTEGTHRFGGTINQYTGDGVMALFGAPLAQDDHARRACSAALQIKSDMHQLSAELQAQYNIDFAVRVGLSSGPVVVGRIGDDLRKDYTAQGATVGLAARMEEMAGANLIYLSDSTAKQVEGYFELRDHGRYRIKGIAERIQVYELRGLGLARQRFELMRKRRLSRFVGRYGELQQLRQGLADAEAGQGTAFSIMAPAGMGKTRLCFEFAEYCREKNIPVFEAQGVAFAEEAPLLPLVEFARNYFGLVNSDNRKAAELKIGRRLERLGLNMGSRASSLLDFLGLGSDEEFTAATKATEQNLQLMQELGKEMLSAGSELQTTVFLIEDLHLFDSASLAYVEQMIASLQDTANLLICNYREGFVPPWQEQNNQIIIELSPLNETQCSAMLKDLLGDDAAVQDLMQPILSRAQGNPFFIEAVIQSLVETGALKGQAGSYRRTQQALEISIPAGIQAVLSTRIDRLPEDSKAVLQTAAIIGQELPVELLTELCSLPVDQLQDQLDILVASDFLSIASGTEYEAYVFQHALVRDVVYENQLSEQRRMGHAAVATAMANRGGAQGELAAVIAQHWLSAEQAIKAALSFQQAGEWALRHDIPLAIRHWQQVVRLLDKPEAKQHEAETVQRLALLARGRLLHLQSRRGITEKTINELLQSGRQLLQAGEQRDLLAYILLAAGSAYAFQGLMAQSQELYEEANTVAEASGDTGVRLVVFVGLLFNALSLNNHNAYQRLANEAIALADGDLDSGAEILGQSPLISIRIVAAWSLIEQGQLDKASAELDWLLVRAKQRRESEHCSWILSGQALIAAYVGLPEQALELANSSLYIAKSTGNRFAAMFGELASITAYVFVAEFQANDAAAIKTNAKPAANKESSAQNAASKGQNNDLLNASKADVWASVVSRATAALKLMDNEPGAIALKPRFLAALAIAQAGMQEYKAARASAKQALLSARENANQLAEAEAQLARVRVRRLAYGKTAAESMQKALDEAEVLAKQSGSRLLLPRIFVEKAAFYALLGKQGEAQTALLEAQQRFHQLGAPSRARLLKLDRL